MNNPTEKHNTALTDAHDPNTLHETLSLQNKERKTMWVVCLAAIIMLVEIFFGYYSKSMALLADGYHMATHVLVFGMSWIAYIILRKDKILKYHLFKKDKILTISGFISAVILLGIAILMMVESVDRLFYPVKIIFEQAILVSAIGFIVNLLSAYFLHHPHSEKDHNFHAAYLHVLADGLTSITAIIALIIGMYYKIYALDAYSGIVSALIIIRWSILLIIKSSKALR